MTDNNKDERMRSLLLSFPATPFFSKATTTDFTTIAANYISGSLFGSTRRTLGLRMRFIAVP
jgi:hypothetical protein